MDLVEFPSSSPPPCICNPLLILQHTRLCQASPFPHRFISLPVCFYLFLSPSFSAFHFFFFPSFSCSLAHSNTIAWFPRMLVLLRAWIAEWSLCWPSDRAYPGSNPTLPRNFISFYLLVLHLSTFHIFLPPTRCQATHGGVIARR